VANGFFLRHFFAAIKASKRLLLSMQIEHTFCGIHANVQTTMNRYAYKQNSKIIETGDYLQSLFSDGFVQDLCTYEKPANAYDISI